MLDSDATNDDVFEFVFFLNANNRVIEKQCNTDDDLKLAVPNQYMSKIARSIRTDKNGDEMDKGLYDGYSEDYIFNDIPAIACDTSLIHPENVQLLINKMPKDTGDKYSASNSNTTYELSYELFSYRATTDNRDGYVVESQKFRHHIYKDSKVNGLYNVTKQGGGEYFLTFDGTVPEKTDSIHDSSNAHVSDNPGTSGIGLLAFGNNALNSVTFRGTSAQWSAVARNNPWLIDKSKVGSCVHCSDGDVALSDEESIK
jgi:hypothetical protein